MSTLDDVLIDLRVFYNLTDEALTQQHPSWIPCRAGCSFCCYSQNTLIAWNEAYMIAREVATWDFERQMALVDRAKRERDMFLSDPEFAELVGGNFGPENLAKLRAALNRHLRPCPFLNRKAGQCMIYEHRPLTCRVYGQTIHKPDVKAEPIGYFCEIVNVAAMEQESGAISLINSAPLFKTLYEMAGAPTVHALPLCFWIMELYDGEMWSLNDPEPMFETMLVYYRSLSTLNAPSEVAPEAAQG